MYGFIDEYGTSQIDTTKDDVSTCFVIAAVIVKDDDLSIVSEGIESIRENIFKKEK